VAGRDLEILHVSFSQPSGTKNKDHIAVGFYVRDRGQLAKETAEAVTTRLRSITGAAYLTVWLRSDNWFLADCGFPAVYAFDGPPNLPPKEAFSKTRYAICSASGSWPVRCFESSSEAMSDSGDGRSRTPKR
jgi:hypothetical protein